MIISILIGIISGIISGMGIGGGTILIPALVFGLNVDQHIAQSINLIYFIPTAVIALIIHIKNKRIDLRPVCILIIFGIIGAIIGSNIAVSVSSHTLKKIFAAFLFFIGIYETFFRK